MHSALIMLNTEFTNNIRLVNKLTNLAFCNELDNGGASFVDHLCYFCLVLLCFHARLLMPCGHLLVKG